jgi:hypothetical protein
LGTLWFRAEKRDLYASAEAFNLLNRTCFGGIITDLTRPDFGLPTGPQVGARSIQLVAKINF